MVMVSTRAEVGDDGKAMVMAMPTTEAMTDDDKAMALAMAKAMVMAMVCKVKGKVIGKSRGDG